MPYWTAYAFYRASIFVIRRPNDGWTPFWLNHCPSFWLLLKRIQKFEYIEHKHTKIIGHIIQTFFCINFCSLLTSCWCQETNCFHEDWPPPRKKKTNCTYIIDKKKLIYSLPWVGLEFLFSSTSASRQNTIYYESSMGITLVHKHGQLLRDGLHHAN